MEATCSLYGLIHARYVLTTAGLEAMYAKYTLQVRCDAVRASPPGAWGGRGQLFSSVSVQFVWCIVVCGNVLWWSIIGNTQYFRSFSLHDEHGGAHPVRALLALYLYLVGVTSLGCVSD